MTSMMAMLLSSRLSHVCISRVCYDCDAVVVTTHACLQDPVAVAEMSATEWCAQWPHVTSSLRQRLGSMQHGLGAANVAIQLTPHDARGKRSGHTASGDRMQLKNLASVRRIGLVGPASDADCCWAQDLRGATSGPLCVSFRDASTPFSTALASCTAAPSTVESHAHDPAPAPTKGADSAWGGAAASACQGTCNAARQTQMQLVCRGLLDAMAALDAAGPDLAARSSAISSLSPLFQVRPATLRRPLVQSVDCFVHGTSASTHPWRQPFAWTAYLRDPGRAASNCVCLPPLPETLKDIQVLASMLGAIACLQDNSEGGTVDALPLLALVTALCTKVNHDAHQVCARFSEARFKGTPLCSLLGRVMSSHRRFVDSSPCSGRAGQCAGANSCPSQRRMLLPSAGTPCAFARARAQR